ncbi:MAG: PAS domain S-box protein [Bacteroidales bacterium]|jgi:PAS domain S-box-containing protein|nr:PAS domain S-box protein [Bacteroidales bacterium]
MQDHIKQLEEENKALKEQLSWYRNATVDDKETLSDPMDITHIRLTDIIPLDHLQSLQDQFSLANGVTSVIVGINGDPITKMSNYSDVCTSKLYAGEDCYVEERIVHEIVPKGHPCRLIDAKAPIFIGEKHIADWKIGMCGFGGSIAPFMKVAAGNDETYAGLFPKLQDEIQEHFKNICCMLEIMANEISSIGYNNLKLTHELLKDKENKERIAESENTIRSIFDHSLDGIILTDTDGIIREWSSGFTLLTGVDKEEAIGHLLWDIVESLLTNDHLDEEMTKLRTEVNSVIDEMKSITLLHPIKHKQSGEQRMLQILYFPVKIPGKKTMMGAISRDITDEEAAKKLIVQNEIKLTENNALLKSIMQTISAPLYVKDKEGYYTDCNSAFLNSFGLSREQVIGKTVEDVFPMNAEEIRRIDEQLMTDINEHQIETLMETGSGLHDFLAYRGAIRNKDNEKTGVVGALIDVTALKNAESALLNEKNRLESLLRNFPNGCMFSFSMDIQTQETHITYLGDTWEKLTNVPKEAAMKGSIFDAFSKIYPEDFSRFEETVKRSAASLVNFDEEVRFRFSDEKTIWLQLSSSPRKDRDMILWDGFALNITERKESEKELFMEKERLQSLGNNFPNGSLFTLAYEPGTKKMGFHYLGGTWEKISGITAEKAQDDISVVFDNVYQEDLPGLMSGIQESLETLTNIDLSIRYHHPDGSTKWIQIASHPHPEGEVIFSDGFLFDITSRKEAEKELLTEKDRLQSLGDNFPGGCLFRFVLNKATQKKEFTYLSGSWEDLTNIPQAVAFQDSTNIFSKIHPDDLEMFRHDFYGALETLDYLNLEFRILYTEEDIRWIQISTHPRTEGNYTVLDGFLLDITKRKTAELELAEYRDELERLVKERTEELEASNEELYAINEELYAINEEFSVTNEELHQKNDQLQQEITTRKQIMLQLEDSESKMRNFISQSFEGITILDEEGRVVEWNKSQEKITGITREEALGQYEWDLMFALRTNDQKTDEVRKQIREKRLAYFHGGHKQSREIENDSILTPSGEVRYIQVSLFTIELAETNFFGRIFHDMTEKRLTDLELDKYRTQLEQMVEAKTQELVASQERLISLSDNLSGGVIFQILNNHFTYISANFSSMFHLPIDETKEDAGLFFDIIHPDDRKQIEMLYQSHPESMVCDAECRFQLDETEKWVHIRAGARIQNNGDLTWDGFMIDITDRKLVEQELEEIRKRQSILIKVLQIVQSSDNMSEAIGEALSEIGKYANVSRVYIFEKNADGKTVNNTYEWCNDGIMPEIDNLQDVPIEYMQDWFDAFNLGKYICTSNIKELTPVAYEQLSQQGIKSILVLPLITNGINYGFVGFDECRRYKTWEKGEVDLIISLSQIISSTTRRFRAENSILLSQQTMRTVLDNINASIYVVDLESSKILFANKKIKEDIGHEVEGEVCWNVLQNQTGTCDFCPRPHLLDDNKKSTGLYNWEHKNLVTKRWYECTDAAIEWVDGRLVHMEYATDITDRKMAEESLRKSEEMYRQLTVASPDAIVVCNSEGRVIYLSPKAREMFLIDEQADTSDFRMFHYVHPHDLKKASDMFQLFVKDNVAFLPQLLLRRKDGTEFFGEISSASVKESNGNTSSVIMVIRDITERKMSEMELIRAKEKAEESDKLKSAFLANMSHEIRTPINGIIGFLNFLADDHLSPKRRSEYISIVNNSSEQLVKLIDDIIDVAKIEAKQMSIRPIPFRINEFMNELQVFFETYLRANNKERIALILDDSEFIENSLIYVDPMRLRQILTNLIGNAIKFTEKGFIRFGYKKLTSNILEFVVEDSGIGLAPDQLEVIFERFRQAELNNSRRYGGTGLGLTISRSLAQMMGGDIRVESEEGEGSCFHFTISYLPVSPQDEHLFETTEEEGEEATDPSLKNSSILIVEPEIMKSDYLERLLSHTGANLILVQTAKQWIDAISQRKHIDVVLADADVFKNENDETIRHIKSIRSGLPLVLIVSEDNEYYQHLIYESQANNVLFPPIHFDNMYQALKKYTHPGK